MDIVKIKTADLHLADYNPRIMPEEEAAALKKSIATFGFVDPIQVNQHTCPTCGDRTNIVIGGHQRLAAVAGDPKFESVPAICLDLHKHQEMQLNIALNKIGGRFDTVKLRKLVRDIQASTPDINLTITGFTSNEIANLLEPVEMPELDAWAKVPDSDMPDHTTMSFTVSTRQAGEILKAVNKMRAQYSLPPGVDENQTIGAGLVALAAHYLKHYGAAH